jgi:outer membrane protein OmpA-like peptidoglycan-associated protein
MGALIWPAASGPAQAGDVSAQQIIDKLAQPRTRSLAPRARSQSDQNLIERLRARTTRSLSMRDRNEIKKIAKSRPAIDLEVSFDFNSAEITPKAVPQLTSLGNALSGPELNGTVVLLGGHTDAKGSDAYNQKLSERRAAAVKQFLIGEFRIPAENLLTAGYGEQELANKSDPFAAENRRVQIVNLASKQEARR